MRGEAVWRHGSNRSHAKRLAMRQRQALLCGTWYGMRVAGSHSGAEAKPATLNSERALAACLSGSRAKELARGVVADSPTLLKSLREHTRACAKSPVLPYCLLAWPTVQW